jgi:hypothetical protein
MSSPRGRTPLDRAAKHDVGTVTQDLLLGHDGIAPGRQRRARQDTVRLPRTELPGSDPPGGDLTDDCESHRMVLAGSPRITGPKSVAVHRRVVPGRDLPPGDHGLGEDAAERLLERDALGVQNGHPGEHALQGLGDGQHACTLL